MPLIMKLVAYLVFLVYPVLLFIILCVKEAGFEMGLVQFPSFPRVPS